MARRQRITEQDERFQELYWKAKVDPPRVLALVAINVDDLADSHQEVVETLIKHCGQPVSQAHPCPEGEGCEARQADLTNAQRYKLAAMEHRGKIIASAAGIILAALAVVFKTGGI